jgi:hypothetical protein
MKSNAHNETLGVFMPVGHVIASFPTEGAMENAVNGLSALGMHGEDIVRYTPQRMIEQVDRDVAHASPLASLGQELNLVKAHRSLAEHGYHFLVIHAPEDDLTQRVASVVKEHGAERAQKYGRWVIEELIEQGNDETQTFESPARGLDAQTPSGTEQERSKHGQR